jgi:dCTP deaminase
MILTDSNLLYEIDQGRIEVHPFDKSLVNPTSLDVRLGDKYTFTRASSFNHFDSSGEIMCALLGEKIGAQSWGCINPQDKNTFQTETLVKDEYWLKPQETVCVSMLEYLRLPSDISAKIMGKSSLGRLGLDNSSISGWVDAKWKGVLTLELTNHSKNALKLTKGMKIGQLVFFRHDSVLQGYDKVGRYVNQVEGQGSLGL